MDPHSSQNTGDAGARTGADAAPAAPQRTSPSHPPPVRNNNNQSYNIHQRIRQHQGHQAGGGGGGGRMNPSIRQSWLFPTHRASPSTAQPEATSVMTVHMNHHAQNSRTEASSSISSTSAAGASTTGSTILNHGLRNKRIINGSARSRLTKIDRLSKMMLNPNASPLNIVDGTSAFVNPASPRRPRPSLHSQSNPLPNADIPSLASPLSAQSQTLEVDAGRAAVDQSTTPIAAASTPTNAPNAASYPRHIIMRASSPHRTIGEHLEMDPPSDAFSSSLPSTTAFPPGIEISNHTGGSGSSSGKTEKASRHTSMPLPKPGWRLYDVTNVEEPHGEQQEQSEGFGAEFKPGGEERSSFQYSTSNASSTTNLDGQHHPYLHQRPVAHSRQESNSTFYTMTPNASNLDLSLASSSLTNLSATVDPSAMSTSDLNIASQPNAQGSNGVGSLPPVPKAIKNSKSPLALRRSSTTSSSSSSSPSNTYLSKGSFPKSSLSAIQQHESKTLTQERQKIVLEILRTERSYVDGLVVLQSLFYEPLNAPYATGNNSGMNTTTSLYSNLGGQPHQHHHQHNHQHTNNIKHHNTNTGGLGGLGGAHNSSAVPASASSPYPSTTMGSNSTLSAAAAPLLTKKSVSEIFSNFSEIIQVNTLLLTQLETRICGATFSTGWESDEDEDVDIGVIKEESSNAGEEDEENEQSRHQQQSLLEEQQQQPTEQKPKQVLVTVKSQGGEKEQLLVLDADWCIGDIFIEIAPFLKMYSNYVKTYTSALTHINECMSRNDRFAEFIKTTAKRPECKNLDFQSYLMLPVQRIPRYRMLLESLLRHTPEDHPDHRKLQSAFKSMEHTANFVNETIRQHEMFGEMVDLQSKITGLAEPLVAPGRALLKRGNVWKVCRRNVQLRVIILLSDCILWTSPSMNPLEDTLTFHRKVGLENCTVIGAEDPDPTKNAFQIISPEKSSQVYVDTPKEKEAWMVAIRKATQEYLSAKRTLKISITPMQSISHFGASFLRRETGMWSPTALRFGFESRSNTFANNVCVDPELESNCAVTARTSLDGWLHNASGTNIGAAQQQQQQQQQPLRVIENYNAPVWLPDHSATSCMLCEEEFGTIFRRKHHCRVCGKVVCHSCSTRTVLIQGTHSEKVGRACDQCIGTMFPEDLNVTSPVSANTASTEPSPIEQHQQRPRQDLRPSDPDRRASSQSLDGVMIRPEDYLQDSAAVSNMGATGMVRGFVEAGLNRMKSRSTQLLRAEINRGNSIAGQGGDSQPKENLRGSNRKADTIGLTNSLTENQTVAQVKACGLCKAEFSMFKWRNICSQCRRVVCSDCLTKKQIDQLFLLGLEAEREANARPAAPAGDLTLTTNPQGDEGTVAELALISPEQSQQWLDPESMTRPRLQQSVSDSAVVTDKPAEPLAPLPPPQQGQQRSQSFKDESSSSSQSGASQSGYGSFGSGWRGMKASNTDSGHGQIEKLCDPCYLGLSLDQVKVLETGGGWQYYQATLSKNQTQDIAAALAVAGDLSLEGNDDHDHMDDDRVVNDGGKEHPTDQEKKALRMLPDSLQDSSVQVV